MDARLLFPNRFLSAPDLKNRDAVLTIAELRVEDLRDAGGGSIKKPVLYFVETRAKAKGDADKEKRLVLNKVNTMQIAKLHGYETNDWEGKKVVLYSTQCQAFGETVDCIRVRPTAPEPVKEKA